MTGRRTLRSWRLLALVALLTAFAGYLFAFCLVLTVRGELPDYSFPRVAGIAVIMALLLAGTVWGAAALRSRTIVDEGGIEVVGAFRRSRYAWAEIEEITLHARGRVWFVYVRTAAGERRLFSYPVTVFGASHERGDYTSAPPETPPRLARRYARLREEWQARRALA